MLCWDSKNEIADNVIITWHFSNRLDSCMQTVAGMPMGGNTTVTEPEPVGYVCCRSKSNCTSTADEEGVSVLTASGIPVSLCVCDKGQCHVQRLHSGVGNGVVWTLPLIAFSFPSSFQVQVGSTPQDQRIVGYISCTHLQAIAGTVLISVSWFFTVPRPVILFLSNGSTHCSSRTPEKEAKEKR